MELDARAALQPKLHDLARGAVGRIREHGHPLRVDGGQVRVVLHQQRDMADVVSVRAALPSASAAMLPRPKCAWPAAPSTGSSLSALDGSTPETPDDAYRSPMRAPMGIGSWCPWPGIS